MKIHALQTFRAKLARDEPTYGLWVTLESATITEIAVALGIDWVVIDAEHGHLDWKEINEHIRAALRSDTVVLVRLAERSTALTKRALDIGADGIVVPWIESVDELREAICDSQYPLEGRRGIGGERATAWGQCFVEHTREANAHVMVVPILESVRAAPHVAAMCREEAIDVFFVGPADYSSSAGYRGEWEGPGVAEQLLQIKDTIRAAGKHCGLMTTSVENLVARREQGFRMLALGPDSGMLLRALHQSLQAVGRDHRPATSLDPHDGSPIAPVMATRPPDWQPDRREVITQLADVQPILLAPGVNMRALASGTQGARGLTTGIVSLEPQAILPYHRHPCTEAITVLAGELEIAVEGRTYRLGPLDHLVIPRWLPHQTRNPRADQPAMLHAAMATSVPERELVERTFVAQPMPETSCGTAGAERVIRWATAVLRDGLGSGVESIDFFQADSVPGIEISGGYARFSPGGRLPPHIHDFDESICIIQGQATCYTEGSVQSVSDFATALVPRGQIHYFANETNETMAMIWVYAGPRPERIVIAERPS